MKKKKTWDRFFQIFDFIHLLIAVAVGLAGAFVLGNLFGMGLSGYTLGFAIAFGGLSLS